MQGDDPGMRRQVSGFRQLQQATGQKTGTATSENKF